MTSGPVIVVDYDAGNLRSVARALEHVGADPLVSADPSDIDRAGAVVLPGVGAKSAQRMAFHLLQRDQRGAAARSPGTAWSIPMATRSKPWTQTRPAGETW